jgi:transposase
MQSEQPSLPELALSTEDSGCVRGTQSPAEERGRRGQKPRFRAIDRSQLQWRVLDIDKLIAEDHPARAIWEFVGGLDLSGYRVQVRAVEGSAGRSAVSPQLLISLWVYAYSQGVNSARAIARLCEDHPAYQWLTGGEVVTATGA